jgi:hypothetical protein
VFGLLLYPWWPGLAASRLPARRYLLVAIMLLAVDWALGVGGAIPDAVIVRLATGLLLGTVVTFYVMPMMLVFGIKSAPNSR